MPSDVLSDADVGLVPELSDADVGLHTEERAKLQSEMSSLRLQRFFGDQAVDALGAAQNIASVASIPANPILKLPRSQGTGVGSGLLNVGAGLAEGLTAPAYWLLPGSKAIQALTAGQVLGHVPESTVNAATTLGNPQATAAQKVEAVAQPIIETAVGGGIARASNVRPQGADLGPVPSPINPEPIPSIIKEGPLNDQIQSTDRVPVEQQGVPIDRRTEVQTEGGTPQRTSEGEQAIPQPDALQEEVKSNEITTQKPAPVESVPEGRLKIAVRFPNGEIQEGRADEGMHAQIFSRLFSEKHRNLISENDPDVDPGWVDSKGKFFTNDQVQKAVGYKPDSFGSGGISVPKPKSTPQPATPPEEVAPTATQTELVGMGGALKEGEIPETGAGGEKYGISQRLREERAQAGQVEPIEPGIGTTGEQSVALGNQLLDQGFDAPKALDEFEETGAINPESAVAIRQYGERLAASARKIEGEFGTDSGQYAEAFQNLTDWDKRSKPIATAAHKLMVAHQGETDLDTGTYTGLARAWADATDRDFTPKQKATAEVIAGNSSRATKTVTKQLGEYTGFMDRATKAPVAEIAALDAASKTVRDADAAMAEAENKARVAATVREQAEAAVRTNAEKTALGAASKTVRENAIRIAKEESLKRVEEAKRAQAVSDIELNRTKKALQAATDNARRAAIAAAKQEVKNRVAQADLVRTVWDHIKTNYLDKGRNDPGDIFTGTATDLGMSAKKVREILGGPKGANRILNEVYKKLSDQRRIVQAAKVWLKEQERPGIERFISKIPRAFFIGRIFGHGTALHVTHSATQAFNPYVADIWWKSFAQQWPFAYKPGYAEMIIRDTLNDKNYTTARRFGLDNDFTSASGDYQAATSKFKGVMRTLAGTKGTDGLKVLRQNIFNRFWDQMPQSTKTATAGKKLAVSVNHMTGSMGATTKVPQTLQWLLFAPKLEGSRWGYSFGDSVKDGMTLARWSEASAEDKHLAKQDIKQKAAIVGVYFSLLAANQGLLSASGSNQKVNFFDPTKSDWLSFKVLGHKVGLIGPMIGEVRFLANMIKTGMENRGKKRDTRTESQEKNIMQYARGKLSPAAGDVSDIGLTQSDFAGRPLPWSDDKVPAYLRRRGEGKYTYPEYAVSQLPIPFEEAAKEAWAEQGVDEPTINKWLKVLSTGAAALTGARVSKDYDAK